MYRLYDSFSACPESVRPLEAINSIVSACPRDLHHNKSCTNGVRVQSTVTNGGCQVPREIGYSLSRRPTSWPENMGVRTCVFTGQLRRSCWAKRPHCQEVCSANRQTSAAVQQTCGPGTEPGTAAGEVSGVPEPVGGEKHHWRWSPVLAELARPRATQRGSCVEGRTKAAGQQP